MEIHFFYMKSLWSGMYVGTVLTFVGGGVRALSTLPGLNQHMSQVGHITALCLSLSLDHGHAHGFSHSFGHGFGHGLVVIVVLFWPCLFSNANSNVTLTQG